VWHWDKPHQPSLFVLYHECLHCWAPVNALARPSWGCLHPRPQIIACSHHLCLSPPMRDVGCFFVINHPMQLATSLRGGFKCGACFDCGADISTMGWTIWLWAGCFECGQTFRLWCRWFNYGVDDSTTGRTIQLWGRWFDYGTDDSTEGQMIWLRVYALTLGWTFRLWGGRFDCRTDVSTVGCAYQRGTGICHWALALPYSVLRTVVLCSFLIKLIHAFEYFRMNLYMDNHS